MKMNKKGLDIGWSIIIKAILVLVGLILIILLIRSFTQIGFESLEGFSLF